MINVTFLGINILLLIVVWKKILKPSILDHFRDKLFDLREEVRDYYLVHNILLSDNTYIQLRNLINNHLLFIDELSFFKMIIIVYKINKRKDLKDHIKKAIEKNFLTNNKELFPFIKSTREEAFDILVKYTIFSSFILLTLVILTAIIFISTSIAKWSKSKLKYIGEDIEKFSYESGIYRDTMKVT